MTHTHTHTHTHMPGPIHATLKHEGLTQTPGDGPGWAHNDGMLTTRACVCVCVCVCVCPQGRFVLLSSTHHTGCVL